MLRSHSQRNGRKLIDVADAVVESHLLLLRPTVPATFAEAKKKKGKGGKGEGWGGE